jgi:hypothetical protein
MVILELKISMELVPQLLRWNMLAHIVIELELLPCQGVDERRNELEESIDDPWDCEYVRYL